MSSMMIQGAAVWGSSRSTEPFTVAAVETGEVAFRGQACEGFLFFDVWLQLVILTAAHDKAAQLNSTT